MSTACAAITQHGPHSTKHQWPKEARRLKPERCFADTFEMTTSELVLGHWATEPIGKAIRVSIALAGIIMAVLILLTASMLASGSWTFVLIGVALAATSARAARFPTALRLGLVAANLVAVPVIARFI